MRDLIDFRLGRYQDVLSDVAMVDLICVDAPYSARTHGGHDKGTGSASRGDMETVRTSKNGKKYVDGAASGRAINYDGWTPDMVREFVQSWSPRCRGWMVSITDHTLAPVWAAAMEGAGRYVFAPLPWLAPGSRVRLTGDGPSCWVCWIIVGRPRTGTFRDGTKAHKWGTLPGGYNVTSERGSHIGGKPSKLMRMLVNDYSRPGDLVCDPCAGWATTLLAAAQEGRRAVGAEMDPETYADALQRLNRDTQQTDLFSNLRREEGKQ